MVSSLKAASQASGDAPAAYQASKSSAPKTSPDWKSLPDAEKAAYLLERNTIPDAAQTGNKRHKNESRSDFIRRIYGV